MSNQKISLLLLKASDEIDWSKEINSNFEINSIAVLDFQFCNLYLLLDALKSPKKFSSLIITSPRGVQSVEKVLSDSYSQFNLIEDWANKIVYVVGPTTATLVEKLGLHTKGRECGNSELLSDVIIKDHACSEHSPLLFISGNLKLEILPSKLCKNGINFHNIVTYATILHSLFVEKLKDHIAHKGSPDFVVFYSPSGVKYAGNLIKENCPHSKLIAVGPTTANTMLNSNMDVFSIPEHPTLQSIMDTITIKSTAL